MHVPSHLVRATVKHKRLRLLTVQLVSSSPPVRQFAWEKNWSLNSNPSHDLSHQAIHTCDLIYHILYDPPNIPTEAYPYAHTYLRTLPLIHLSLPHPTPAPALSLPSYGVLHAHSCIHPLLQSTLPSTEVAVITHRIASAATVLACVQSAGVITSSPLFV